MNRTLPGKQASTWHRIRALWGLVLLLGSQQLPAQPNATFRQLTQADGLPSNRVNAIAEDDLGNLWVGTSTGLVKYDGSDFYPIVIRDGLSLDATNISNLLYDSQKNLWIGTVEFGLYAINTYTGQTQVYFHETNDPQSLPDNRITTIIEDQKGQVWFGVHRKGLCRIDPETGKFANFRPSLQIPGLEARTADVVMSQALDVADSNRIWFGTLEGLFSMDNRDGSMRHYPCTPENLSPKGLYTGLANLIRSIHAGNANELWLGTWGGGLLKFDIQSGQFTTYIFEPQEPVSQIRNVIKDIRPQGTDKLSMLLLGNLRGFGTFDLRTKAFDLPYADQAGISNSRPTCYYYDRKNNLWVGSDKGLFVLLQQHNPFQFHSLPYIVNKVFLHPNGKQRFISLAKTMELLVEEPATQSARSYSFTPLLFKGGNIHSVTGVHFLPDGRVWVMENTDLYNWEADRDTLKPIYKFEVPEIRSNHWGFLDAQLDKSGNMWLGNKYAGLYHLEMPSGQLTHYFHRKNDPGSIVHTAWIFDVFEDSKGNIWYGTEEGWGYREIATGKFVNFPYDSKRSGKPGVQLKEVTSMAEDSQGRIWLGSPNRGLTFVTTETKPSEVLRTFTTADGLRSDAIQDMCSGPDDNLWLVTKAGLSQLNTRDFSIRNFGTEYGLKNLRQVSVGPDGTVFIGANGGYFHFDPKDLNLEKTQPEVLLRSFKVFGADYAGDHALNYLEKVTLDHDQNFLSFEYAALNFFNADLVEYAYRMDGVDPDWVYAGKRKFCNYTDLRPGKKTFQVRARVEDQDWGPASSLQIQIRFPFWKTWWFISLSILLSALLIGAVVRWRINQIRQQVESERAFNEKLHEVEKKALQAQMNPHFLFNCLNSIKLLILKSEKEKAASYLTTFSKLIRLVLQNSEQSMINLADELQALELYVALERLRLNDQFEYEVVIAEDIRPEHLQYPPLVLQPMVENAIWHGLSQKNGPGKLQVRLHKVADGLEIVIVDNGIGRAAAAGLRRKSRKGKSFGVAITRERLRLAFARQSDLPSGKLEIEDLQDEAGQPVGTLVRIVTPILRIS